MGCKHKKHIRIKTRIGKDANGSGDIEIHTKRDQVILEFIQKMIKSD